MMSSDEKEELRALIECGAKYVRDFAPALIRATAVHRGVDELPPATQIAIKVKAACMAMFPQIGEPGISIISTLLLNADREQLGFIEALGIPASDVEGFNDARISVWLRNREMLDLHEIIPKLSPVQRQFMQIHCLQTRK